MANKDKPWWFNKDGQSPLWGGQLPLPDTRAILPYLVRAPELTHFPKLQTLHASAIPHLESMAMPLYPPFHSFEDRSYYYSCGDGSGSLTRDQYGCQFCRIFNKEFPGFVPLPLFCPVRPSFLKWLTFANPALHLTVEARCV